MHEKKVYYRVSFMTLLVESNNCCFLQSYKKSKPIIVHAMVFNMTLLLSPLLISQYYVILLFHVDRVSQTIETRNLLLEIASHCDLLYMLGILSMSDVGHLMIIVFFTWGHAFNLPDIVLDLYFLVLIRACNLAVRPCSMIR